MCSKKEGERKEVKARRAVQGGIRYEASCLPVALWEENVVRGYTCVHTNKMKLHEWILFPKWNAIYIQDQLLCLLSLLSL